MRKVPVAGWRDGGHSLVELLVAVALLTTLAGGMLGAGLAAARLHDRVERRVCALLLAEDLLSERQAGPGGAKRLARVQVSGLHWVKRNLEWVEENEGITLWSLRSREFLRSFKVELRVAEGRVRATVVWGHRKTAGTLTREGRAS